MTMYNHASTPWAKERRQFRFIYGVFFVLFLIIAPFARLLPSRWRPWSVVNDGRLSLIAEARAVTQRVLPFAFL